MGGAEGQSQLLDEGWHAEIRTRGGSGGWAERRELRFRGDRGVARGDEGFQATVISDDWDCLQFSSGVQGVGMHVCIVPVPVLQFPTVTIDNIM